MRRLPRKPGPIQDPALGNALAGVETNSTRWPARRGEAPGLGPGGTNWLVEMIEPLQRVTFIGACAFCDAHARFRPAPPHVRLEVFHNGGCPVLAAR